MSQNSQLQNTIAQWSRFQSELWENCLGLAQDEQSAPWKEAYSRPLDVSEDAIHTVLQAQSDCLRIALKSMRPGNGAPRVMGDWLDQIETSSNQCLEAQQNAWHTWFAALRQLDPSGSGERSETASSVFDAWREATEQTFKTQADWMSSVVSSGSEAGARIANGMLEASPAVSGGNGAQSAEDRSAQSKASAAKSGDQSKGAQA